jgi:hypothetical protein
LALAARASGGHVFTQEIDPEKVKLHGEEEVDPPYSLLI